MQGGAQKIQRIKDEDRRRRKTVNYGSSRAAHLTTYIEGLMSIKKYLLLSAINFLFIS
jgi:hypothetical protein